MMLKVDGKIILLIVLSILFMSNFVIIFDIPILRQLFGFLFLMVLPGFLLLQTIKLKDIKFVEYSVLLVGLSISFLMIYGLFLNNILIYFGYIYPLSTSSLLVSFDLVFLFLIIILYSRSQDIIFDISCLKLKIYDKAFLAMSVLFPALIVFGTYLMISNNNNFILLFTLILMSICIVGICYAKLKISKNIYSIVVYSISISLLLIFMLRFTHINGHDVHFEYYIFQTTLGNLRWSTFLHSTLDSTLSISLLPAIFQSILNMESQEFLFKGVYVVICSFSPLAIYIIANKYVDEMYAFLASVFFMAQSHFLVTAGSPRTSLAIFFVALAIMVLLNDNISQIKRRGLFLIFIVSIILSHYSTSYITFIMFISSFILLEIVRMSNKLTFEKRVTSISIVLFFTLMFAWYSMATEVAFSSGVKFIVDTIAQFNNFFVEESRSSQFVKLAGKELAHPIVSRINLVNTFSAFFYIGVGVLTIIYRFKSMVSFSNIMSMKPSFLKSKFDMQYLAMVVMCSGLLVIMLVLPHVSVGYGIQRLFLLAMVVLSICFVIGGTTLSKYLHIAPHLLILIVLVPYFLFSSGFVNTIIFDSGSITLNSDIPLYDLENVYESESVSAKWLKSNIQTKSQVYVPDSYTSMRLVSQGLFLPTDINDDVFKHHKKPNEGYIYLGYNNIVNEELIVEKSPHDLKNYSDIFDGMDKIFDNAESEVYHR